MKHPFISALLICLSFSSYAEIKDNSLAYLSSEFYVGSAFGGGAGMTLFLKQKSLFELGAAGFISAARNIPEDYKPGLAIGPVPSETMTIYYLKFGRAKVLDNNGVFRASFNLGLAYTSLTRPINFVRRPKEPFVSNYTYDNHDVEGMSIIVNPKAEFAIAPFLGAFISPSIHLNTDRKLYFINFGMMIGLVRDKL